VTSFATANGGVTIGMTSEGRALEVATMGMPWSDAQPLWSAASERFAAERPAMRMYSSTLQGRTLEHLGKY
jgi:hypothetical protein